jgi:catechol 2,3-dioxygenase-like lactoylglutathione lyase family enzyme
VTRVEIYVSDLTRSLAFYEGLGFRRVRGWGDWALLDLEGNVIALQGDEHALAGPHYFTARIKESPRGTGVEISIDVEDIDRLYELARRLGVDIVKPIQDRPWHARDFRVADPDGYFLRFTTPLDRGNVRTTRGETQHRDPRVGRP